MDRRRVVITGMGLVTPLGLNVAESWAGVRAGACGIGPITLYDPAGQKVRLAGEVKGFDPERAADKREARKMDRFTQFAMAAAAEAMAESGLSAEQTDAARCAVFSQAASAASPPRRRPAKKGARKGSTACRPTSSP